jgi:apolipoprotein N-acyltransferase
MTFKAFNKKLDFFSKIHFFQKKNILDCLVFCKEKWQNFINDAITSNTKKHLLLVFCIGLLNFFAVTPFCFIIILPLTFGSLFYIFEKRHYSGIISRLLTIFAFLCGYFTSIFWWLFVPLTVDFSHLFWLIPFALFGIPVLLSTVFIIFFTICFVVLDKFFYYNKNISQNVKDILFVFVFLLCWFLGDYVRGHFIFGGFPWMLFGHFITYPFALQSVRFLGIDLYSIFCLYLALIPYILLFKRKNKFLKNISFFVLIFWFLNCLIGCIYLSCKQTNKLGINVFASQPNVSASVQMNIKQIRETISENAKILSIFSGISKPSLMLMPEGSINFNIDSGDILTKNIGRLIPNDDSLLLAGGIDAHGVSPYNVIYAINKDGYILDVYKKQKLVPFGEYIPFRRFFPHLTRLITGGNFDFSTSKINDLFVLYRDLPIIYPIICYESIFPDLVKKNIELSRKQINYDINEIYAKQVGVKTLNERGEIIVNLTNDAWMKWSTGAYQHFLMARFLAISTGLPVIRVSNNGFSAFIDSCGRIIEKTKLNKKDLLTISNFKR